MKAITVREAEGQFGRLVAEACRGETIVPTDGGRRVTLEPGAPLDLEGDNPELEAELSKEANGPFRPCRESELREIADRALQEHRARRQK